MTDEKGVPRSAVQSATQISELDDASNACLELASKHGYATGHGDTVADMIREFSAQIPAVAQGSRGCGDIAAERQRQISKEGWTPAHDDEHGDGAMAVAAALYAIGQTGQDTIVSPIAPHWRGETLLARLWPWSWDWWKPKDRRSDLVRAGALIAAEIDRIDRASSVPSAQLGGPRCTCARADVNLSQSVPHAPGCPMGVR